MPPFTPQFLHRQFCRRHMDEGIKKDVWSVMEDFFKAPGGMDFSKMKSQYDMFVDAVGARQVFVSVSVSHKIMHCCVNRTVVTDNIVCTASF
jgi:hypothetical protein